MNNRFVWHKHPSIGEGWNLVDNNIGTHFIGCDYDSNEEIAIFILRAYQHLDSDIISDMMMQRLSFVNKRSNNAKIILDRKDVDVVKKEILEIVLKYEKLQSFK